MTETDFKSLEDQYDSADIFPVINRYPADLITPLCAYLALSAKSDHSFLFESVEGGEHLARYSFLGADPEICFGDSEKQDCVAELIQHLECGMMAHVPDIPSFSGGVVGYFEFSDVAEFEPALRSLKRESEKDRAPRFMLFRRIVAFDHAKQELMVISLVFKKNVGDKTQFRGALERAEVENRSIGKTLESPFRRPTRTEPSISSGAVKSNWKKKDFLAAVEEVKESIRSGDAYQVVLSQCFSKQTKAGPIPIYRALRSLNPSPYMFVLQIGERSIVGASPEMLLRSRGRKLEYRPIAGTRPRGAVEEEDERLASELQADRKEIAEHTMLVDLGRNDLGRVADFGSVKVRGLMSIEKYSHVQHLVTYLTARLRDGKDRFEAFASCFPAGTVSGAPKIKAIEIIQRLEPTPRGVYAGAVGYFDYAGNLDTCIAIRTLVLENGIAKVQAGAGIVADSVPESEYEETIHKAAGLLKAVELAESGKYGI